MLTNSMRLSPAQSSERPAATVSLFYSYSHKNEDLQNKLEAHLSVLQTNGVISGWHDRRIVAGIEWDGAISKNLEEAGIILLLVSAEFLASRYCRDVEVKRAMERHEAETARVIPIILKPCDWHDAPFGRLQALPKDGKPVTKWRNRDEAFTDVVRGIKDALENFSLNPLRRGQKAGIGKMEQLGENSGKLNSGDLLLDTSKQVEGRDNFPQSSKPRSV